jgi:threonine/homoserine/homoserine lactone efflux protein
MIGGGFAFAAAVQPGPLQAYLLSSVAQRGWKRTLPASLAPLVSDGPIAVLALVVLNGMPAPFRGALQLAGGVFLIYLAWRSYRQWKTQTARDFGNDESVPRTVLQAAMVNFLNPNPYLGWTLVLGPECLAAWRVGPANAAALIAAFYATMVTVLAATILLFGTTRFLGSRGRRALVLVSATALAALGVYQLVSGVFRARAG